MPYQCCGRERQSLSHISALVHGGMWENIGRGAREVILPGPILTIHIFPFQNVFRPKPGSLDFPTACKGPFKNDFTHILEVSDSPPCHALTPSSLCTCVKKTNSNCRLCMTSFMDVPLLII